MENNVLINAVRVNNCTVFNIILKHENDCKNNNYSIKYSIKDSNKNLLTYGRMINKKCDSTIHFSIIIENDNYHPHYFINVNNNKIKYKVDSNTVLAMPLRSNKYQSNEINIINSIED